MDKKFDEVNVPLSEIAQREIDQKWRDYAAMMDLYQKDKETHERLVRYYIGCWFYYALGGL